MRKPLSAIGLASSIVLILLGPDVVIACGDKLLALGRGVRFQRAYTAAHPASILIYTARNARPGEPEWQSTLKSAGHKLQVAGDASQAHYLLKSGRFDLVLADLSDATALADEARAIPSRPMVLPVMYKPSKSDVAAAEKRYGLVLKATGHAGEYLAAVEKAMKMRAHNARS